MYSIIILNLLWKKSYWRNFSLVEYKKDSVRKGEHWFSLRASHPLFYL